MLDFVRIEAKKSKNGTIIRPIFDSTIKSKDILIRSKEIYGIWNEDGARWDRTFEDAARLIDKEVFEFFELYKKEHPNESVSVAPLRDSTCPSSDDFVKYIRRRTSTDVVFDGKLIFKSDPYKREDYSTHRLDYDICEGSTEYYDKLMDTLYDKDERRKIEWFIGAIVNGDNAKIQKFAVFYGAPGTGKSTVLNIIERLFKGYSVTFESGAICSSRDQFSMAPFKNNPLVAIDHDGDLSHADTNTRMNSLVSHEPTRINEKNEKAFTISPLAILFIGTNEPVKITSSKSGILRRLIDINPSGRKLSGRDYKACVKHIEFELGAIAKHCKEVYLEDPDYYIDYRPTEMMAETNDFYDFMLTYYDAFANEDYVTLKVAWARYKEYCDDCGYSKVMPRRDFKHEIKNYFSEHETQLQYVDSNGKRQHASNAYLGFKKELFSGSMSKIKDRNDDSDTKEVNEEVENKDIYEGLPDWLHLKDSNECEANVFEKMFNDARAQYATTGENEVPKKSWNNDDGSFNVKTKLSDILLLNQVHYVLTQETEPSLIVIDFDRKDKDGKKSLRLNLEAASTFPRTYAEVSKGGQGLHLHYIYDGDVNELSRLYDDEIEIKVFKGLSALRRRLTLCNNEKIAHINSGLPLKGEKGAKMIDPNVVLNEKAIRTSIRRNLAKEYHADTTSSVHFIKKILDDAYASGETYDVRDLRTAVMNFAAKATNQSQHCMELVMQMEFCSKGVQEADLNGEGIRDNTEDISNVDDNGEDTRPIVFYDIEIFPNLFVVCYKKAGPGGKENCVKMINPTANDVENLISTSRLIGFNNRRYDNHMLYARILGYSNEKLFELSNKLINSDDNTKDKFHGFTEAYNISYTDVWDFAINKQSLKKWEIELGIHHQELGLPWDKPAPKDRWEEIADYCCNDVVATEATFNHLETDWEARQILADISGGTVNDTTNALTLKLVFGDVKKPKLIYTNLATGEQVESMGGL